ncbi:MAG: EpsG family protein [Aliarcobacter butzleri]|nr:EpsG family protein [Aliarcobacter butzleri]
MIPYIIIYSFSLILLISSYLDRKNTKLYYIIFLYFLILFAGLRYNIGVDYQSYIDFFNLILSGQDIYMEDSFILLVKFINFIGGTEQLLFFIYAFLTITFTSKFIEYFSQNKVLSLYIYFTFAVFYFASFNGVRQALAVAIFVYSIKFIIEKNLLKYILFIVIATFIHKTAILMLPLYFILNKKLNIMKFFFIALGYYVILQFFEQLILFIGISQAYLNNFDSIEGNGINPFVYLLCLMFIFLYKVDFQYKVLGLNLIFFAILLGITPLLTTIPSTYIVRMTSYFTFGILFILPNLMIVFNNKNLKNIYFFTLIVFGGLYMFRNIYFLGERYLLVPYQINLNLF